jgi:hypothetical protein
MYVEWTYSSTFLNLGIRQNWAVSFTLRSLYPQGNSTRHFGGCVGHRTDLNVMEKNLLPLPGTEP